MIKHGTVRETGPFRHHGGTIECPSETLRASLQYVTEGFKVGHLIGPRKLINKIQFGIYILNWIFFLQFFGK